jgi:hypothetical protein
MTSLCNRFILSVMDCIRKLKTLSLQHGGDKCIVLPCLPAMNVILVYRDKTLGIQIETKIEVKAQVERTRICNVRIIRKIATLHDWNCISSWQSTAELQLAGNECLITPSSFFK